MKALSLIKFFCVLSVFSIAMAVMSFAQGLTTLHSFSGSDGANPAAAVVLATDGNLYGTTYSAGPNGINAGTVFKITPSGNFSTVYDFCQQPPYCSDGLHPLKMIQGRDANFYGVTQYGGDIGNIFKLTPSGNESSLFTFCSPLQCTNGSNPTSLMQASDGNFYGLIANGGNDQVGAFWQLVANSWAFNLLYGFDGTVGLYPMASLVQGQDGQLYGVSPHGGSGNPDCASYCGTAFRITLSGDPTLLYSFCSQADCTDGSIPSAALVQSSDGNFYGSTYSGGANGAGTIFKIAPSGTMTVLHSFGGNDGSQVFAPLIQGTDGNFYGVASAGGTHGDGTIFQITPSGAYTVLYNFAGSDGADPLGAMVQDAQGNFYGTTNTGGTSNDGTVFKFQLSYYTLAVNNLTGQGTVTSSDGYINCPGTCNHSYLENSQVTLTANPAQGWQFSGWGGACTGSNPSCTVTMSGNETVSAAFVQSTYTLTVSMSGDGSITSNDGYINCPGSCSHTYLSLTQVTLNAAPTHGWDFVGWSGACSGTGPCQLTMLGNYGVSAYFIQPGSGSQFSPVTPCRLIDTRNTGNPIQGGTSQNFIIPQLGGCNIPTAASAYSLNVTVVPHGSLGYITVWPAGLAQPLISTMNARDGRTKASAVIVQAGTGDAVSIYASNTTDVILDINGYFGAPSSQTYQFYPMTPCRVIDTRNADSELGGPPLVGGQPRNFAVLTSSCMPQNVTIQAYSFNVTVVPYPSGQPLHYLTVWPEGETQPQVSTLNNRTATTVANAAIVPAGSNGGISVYASDSTELVVDIVGYFAAPTANGMSLYATAPCRVIDTRSGGGQPWRGEKTINVADSTCAPPSNAQAYVFNATVVPPGPMHYLTLWPDPDQQPLASTLNAIDGAVTSNMAIMPNINGSTDAYASDLTQLILDISSFFAP